MPQPDIAPFAARIVVAVKGHVERAMQPFLERLKALEMAVKEMPAGQKGEKGDPGESGRPGKDGIDGKDGAPGKEGTPGRDGQAGAPGPSGRDGKDGANGRDGFGLEDFDIKLDGRNLTLSFERGDVKIERCVRLDTVLDCGVYKPETKYEKGDGVTFGGHYWIAKKDDPEFKPGDPADNPGGEPTCWRLAVRRGRDGKGAK